MSSVKDASPVENWNIEETSGRTIGRRLPVCGTTNPRKNSGAFFSWNLFGIRNGVTMAVKTVRPGHFRKRFSKFEMTGCCIQHVEESVSIRLDEKMLPLAVNRFVYHHRNLSRIPVENIMRGKLEIPSKRATVRIQRYNTISVKVVAVTGSALKIR